MKFNEFKDRFSIQLNEQQLAAVKAIKQPTLLLAVPGSGKTTVLVTRLGYMIYCCGILPEQILIVTYTVAATKDMKQRFIHLFSDELVEQLEFRTINGICAKIINYYGRSVGKQAFELVKEEGYKIKLLSELYLNLVKEYPTESDLQNLSTSITYIKNRMLSKSEIEALGKEQDIPLLEIYMQYNNQMKQHSLMDFDDQMVYAYTMLKNMPQLLAHFQEQYQYICVDEAQDTSKIQHEIIQILSKKYENLFMVGDEDQSIYGFRAAYPQALLDFEKEHTNANILLMEKNYRSSAQIVEAADKFIQKNEFRHKKSMHPSKEAGCDIKNIEMRTRKGQYSYLQKVAFECNEETAILYRDNESILPVIDLLERNLIPYRIKNADLTFFSNRVVLDIKKMILFAQHPSNTELFLQIYYKIGTYMNKAAAIEACRMSELHQIPVIEAALSYCTIHAGTQKSLKSIQTHLQKILQESAEKALYRIVKFMGYKAYLERAHINESKLQILEAIASNEPSAIRLVERLEELSTLIKQKKYEKNCNLIFSTIHSSKGLEYERVFLLDVKDGIFPETVIENRKNASKEEIMAYEEERRLFYVGVTRAKSKLNIFGFTEDSTFTREFFGIKKEEKKADLKKHATQELKKATAFSHINSYDTKETKRIVTQAEYLDKQKELQTTGYVKHKTLGEGKLISIKGDNLLIEFQHTQKKCKLKFMMEHMLLE